MSTIRAVHTVAKIGGNGNANPHQKIAPKGKSASERMAPVLAPLYSSHPATHSSTHTAKNADSKGTLDWTPMRSKGPLP